MWGMANILKALKFLNEDAKQVHGYIHPSSIFVTQSGSWKLGFFDLTYEFKPKEDPPYFYLEKQQLLPTAYRSPERTDNNFSLIGDCTIWGQDMYGFGELIDFVFKGLKIPGQLSNYVLRCKSAPLGRPAPSRLLAAFSKHPLVKSLNFLEEKAIKDPIQKEAFFNQLNSLLAKFPSAITVEFILPLLMDELVHGQTEFAPIVLPSVIIIGSSLPAERFSREISPLITQLFGRRDRATRLQLLKNLDSYIKLIDRRVVNSDIFPQVILGLSDTSASMREATIRVMIPLTPLLDRENQEKMVRGLGSLQADPLPAIRTNILVCLNHIVADLEASVRRQFAFPCIGRGMKDPFPKARIQSLKTIKNTQHYFDDGLLARRILPSLCPLLWDVETTVRDTAFDVVQSLLNRIYAGHQEWTKTGSEPKAPVEPSKDAPSMLQATGGYVTSAMSWVAGSLIGKSANATETAATATAAATTAASESAGEKMPKAVSSSTVNSVLPAITRTELSMEELEHLGEPSKAESTLERMDSLEDDVWGEEGKEDAKKKKTTTSEEGWESEGLKAMGGWDDTGLNFSDEENKELEKESQNLEMIRQMAERMKTKSESPKKSDEGWEDEFGGTKKTRTRRTTAAKTTKSAAKPTKISDDDLMAMLNDDKPLPAKNTAAKKASDGWDDGWDDEPAKKPAAKKASDGWDDDWNEEPASAPTSKKASDGWDDWDAQPASASKSAAKKASDGWDDDWDAQPASTSTSTKKASDGWDDWDAKPAQPAQPARSAARAPKVSKAASGWDDWDDAPTTTKTTKTKMTDGWDDDWDAQPATKTKTTKTTKTTTDGWDDDW